MRHLILIDQEPLRRSAATACADAMAQLDYVRAGWHRFEREDKPAFARWRAREFGTLLSQAREVEVQIRDYQTLIHEVEMEMQRRFQDPHTAYQRVMFRRENPGLARDDADEAAAAAGSPRPVSDFEKEALFQEWVQKSLGTNPDKMDDEAYETTFEAFKTHMFRAPRDEPPSQNIPRPQRPSVSAELDDNETEHEPDAPIDVRLKELYRRLVRRLHPDLRADGNAAVSGLWHEVQEAYLAGDVARMEILLALSDLAANHMDDATSLAQMRALLAELERAYGALEKSLLEAEGEDAWNFARTGPGADLRLRVQRELRSELAARTLRRDLLARTIAAWAQGPIANRQVTVSRSYAGRAR
ncbi:MAG: J domain-containing protein [Chthoniobacterales bacterium]